MTSSFEAWLDCPECDGNAEVGVLAHSTDVVLECYGCGHVSEFRIGLDIPFNDLDAAAIEDAGAEPRDGSLHLRSRSGDSFESDGDPSA